jgi:hypothetical protein
MGALPPGRSTLEPGRKRMTGSERAQRQNVHSLNEFAPKAIQLGDGCAALARPARVQVVPPMRLRGWNDPFIFRSEITVA